MKRMPFDPDNMIQKLDQVLSSMGVGNSFKLIVELRAKPKPKVFFEFSKRDTQGNRIIIKEDMSDWLEETPYIIRKPAFDYLPEERLGPMTWDEFFHDPNGRIAVIKSRAESAGMNFTLEELR